MTNIPTTTTIMQDSDKIGQDLRAGKISNPVARTLLEDLKVKLKALSLEAEFSKLGCEIQAVALYAEDRKRPGLRQVS